MEPRSPRCWRRALPFAALLLLAGSAFHNGLDGRFVLDDVPLIQDFPCAREPLQPLQGLLLVGSGDCAYRPFRYLTYALDYAIYGENPVGYHVSNLLLHGLAVVLVFLLLRRLLAGDRGDGAEAARLAEFGAFAGAALFAVHPVQVDAVTYVSGRRDVLHALLYLGCVLGYLQYRRTGRRRWAAMLVPLYYLALQSKEMAITLPGMLLLVDAAWDKLGAGGSRPAREGSAPSDSPAAGEQAPAAKQRSRIRRILSRARDAAGALLRPLRRHPVLYGTLFAIGIAFFVYRGLVLPVTHHPGFWGGSRSANTATALGTVPGYARLVLWPDDLLADYSPDAYPIQTGFGAALPLAGLTIYLGLLGLALFGLAWRPRLALAAGWIALALLPVMHIVPHHELMAEHYLYLPLVGVALAAGAGFAWVRRRSKLIAAVALAALVVPLGLRTVLRNLDWDDEWSLWAAEFAVTDDCARAHANYAALLWAHPERDTPDRSRLERHLERALWIQGHTRAGVCRFEDGKVVAELGAVRVWHGQVEEGLGMLRWTYAELKRKRVERETQDVFDTYVVTLLNLGGPGADETSRARLREAWTVADDWLGFAEAPQYVHLLRGRASHGLCELAAAREDYAEAMQGPDPKRTLEAVELTVECSVDGGDLAAAAAALQDAENRGLRSPQLDAFRRAVESGEPPPAPRCGGRPGTADPPPAAGDAARPGAVGSGR